MLQEAFLAAAVYHAIDIISDVAPLHLLAAINALVTLIFDVIPADAAQVVVVEVDLVDVCECAQDLQAQLSDTLLDVHGFLLIDRVQLLMC